MPRTFFLLGSLSAMFAVIVGAFGAHGLRDRVSAELLATFETGARYHMYHAFALIAAAWAVDRWPQAQAAQTAGWLFVGGTLVFSGSLYLLALTGQRWLGAVTPIGGLLFIAGWAMLAWAAYQGG